MGNVVTKLGGYRRRIVYEWNQFRQTAAVKKRERIFETWLTHLAESPPDVLLGANFAAYGGVRHHLQAIQRYSAMNVELAPPEQVMKFLGAHHVVHDFDDKFWQFPANGIKVVHSHVFPWFIEWCREQQSNGKRWVHTYHLNYYPEHANGVLETWQSEINLALIEVACHADVRLSVSKWQKAELQRQYGIETEYLPNGVDVAMSDQADARRFGKKYGINGFILYVGRNTPVKNPKDFMKLSRNLPGHQFVMIGGGLTQDTIRNEWQQDIPKNLKVIGSLSQREVQDAIAACSTLVVTSKREGLPTLVLEGMAQRKPLVVSDEPGSSEAVDHGYAGYIYEQGNITDLAEKVLCATADKKIGTVARQRVLVEYDWRVVAPKLDEIYRGFENQ